MASFSPRPKRSYTPPKGTVASKIVAARIASGKSAITTYTNFQSPSERDDVSTIPSSQEVKGSDITKSAAQVYVEKLRSTQSRSVALRAVSALEEAKFIQSFKSVEQSLKGTGVSATQVYIASLRGETTPTNIKSRKTELDVIGTTGARRSVAFERQTPREQTLSLARQSLVQGILSIGPDGRQLYGVSQRPISKPTTGLVKEVQRPSGFIRVLPIPGFIPTYSLAGQKVDYDRAMFSFRKFLDTQEQQAYKETTTLGSRFKQRFFGFGSSITYPFRDIQSSKKTFSKAALGFGLGLGFSFTGPVISSLALIGGTTYGAFQIPKLQEQFAEARFRGPAVYRELLAQETIETGALIGGSFVGAKFGTFLKTPEISSSIEALKIEQTKFTREPRLTKGGKLTESLARPQSKVRKITGEGVLKTQIRSPLDKMLGRNKFVTSKIKLEGFEIGAEGSPSRVSLIRANLVPTKLTTFYRGLTSNKIITTQLKDIQPIKLGSLSETKFSKFGEVFRQARIKVTGQETREFLVKSRGRVRGKFSRLDSLEFEVRPTKLKFDAIKDLSRLMEGYSNAKPFGISRQATAFQKSVTNPEDTYTTDIFTQLGGTISKGAVNRFILQQAQQGRFFFTPRDTPTRPIKNNKPLKPFDFSILKQVSQVKQKPPQLDSFSTPSFKGASRVISNMFSPKPKLQFIPPPILEGVSRIKPISSRLVGISPLVGVSQTPISIPKQIPSSLPRQLPQQIPRQVPRSIPKQIPRQIPRSIPKQIPQSIPKQIPQTIPKQIPQQIPKIIPKQIPRQIPRGIPRSIPIIEEFVKLPPNIFIFDFKLDRKKIRPIKIPKTRRKRPTRYQPSLVAVAQKIFGTTRRPLTGLGVRKLPTRKKKKRKRRKR